MATIIAVDDDVDICGVLKDFFSLEKFEVLAIGHDGNEAIELYKKHQPDVVLLDVSMPKFDGLYALEKIIEYNPNAKVIMATAFGEEDTMKKKCFDLGASYVISKPFDMNELIQTIKKTAENRNFTVS